jgi:hypothetical protein
VVVCRDVRCAVRLGLQVGRRSGAAGSEIPRGLPHDQLDDARGVGSLWVFLTWIPQSCPTDFIDLGEARSFKLNDGEGECAS